VDRALVVDLAAERVAGTAVDQENGCDCAHSARWCHLGRGR
jgi:hypothetical protein